ncbi:MAG: hydroxymethylbilane synthase [Elusimicrobia bacterium]|nr:hydroxymethylbilane synthase [Elusimicrobiota bacterium]
MATKLKLGTRGSKLALVQAEWVRAQLLSAHPGLDIDLVVIKTSGDRASQLGIFDEDRTKALFVKEIEEALLLGEIDFGVHSTKDLPADLPSGLEIVAYPIRESPWDVMVLPRGKKMAELSSPALIGTSSLRRQLQLRRFRPDVQFAPSHGNVDTRLKKLESGEFSALVLAEAGLKRLGLRNQVNAEVCREMVPAPGQGALAVEARIDRSDLKPIFSSLDHPETRRQVEAERILMRLLGGGCRVPFGALAELGTQEIRMAVFWCDPAGKNPIFLQEKISLEPKKMLLEMKNLVKRIREESSPKK